MLLSILTPPAPSFAFAALCGEDKCPLQDSRCQGVGCRWAARMLWTKQAMNRRPLAVPHGQWSV